MQTIFDAPGSSFATAGPLGDGVTYPCVAFDASGAVIMPSDAQQLRILVRDGIHTGRGVLQFRGSSVYGMELTRFTGRVRYLSPEEIAAGSGESGSAWDAAARPELPANTRPAAGPHTRP